MAKKKTHNPLSLREPELGAIHWTKLYDGMTAEGAPKGLALDDAFEGVEVGLRYVGTDTADAWLLASQAARIDEVKRLVEHREGLDPRTAPELFNGTATTGDGFAANLDMVARVLREVVAGVRSGDEQLEGEDAVRVALSLPVALRTMLMNEAMEVQTLRRRHVFLASDPGDVAAGGPAAA